jgi:hypothetical protein
MSDSRFYITDQEFTTASRKIFANNDSNKFQMLHSMGHRIRRNNPATFTQFGRNIELYRENLIRYHVKIRVFRWITCLIVYFLLLEMKSNQRYALTISGAKNLEVASIFQLFGKVISCKRQIFHDVRESSLSETNKDIILRNNVASTFTKIKSE